MRPWFADIPVAIPDPILGVTEAFRADTSKEKVNLGVGIYQDGDGAVPILESIRKASALWLSQEDTKAYLPIDGVPSYNDATQINLFGVDSAIIREKRATTVQAVGGSGALRLGAEFLRTMMHATEVYVSDPSWENHQVLFSAAGFKVSTYPYYDKATSGLRSADMLETLRTLPEQSIVLLHGCCHNPTGVDLSKADWDAVVEICATKALIPFIDLAYQGFADGLENDAYAVRLFANKGLSFVVSSSYAKSFALYRERAGALTVVTGSAEESKRVNGQLKRLVRTIYSSPPSYGGQLVSIVLNTPELRTLWLEELEGMRTRILQMRALFVDQLQATISERDFSFILRQRGMFSYSGLSADVIRYIRERYHIYALESGRICVAAMNKKNVHYICEAIAEAIKKA